MTTPYDFGFKVGQFKFADERAERMREIEERKARLRGLGNQVKPVTPAVDDPFEEIAGVTEQANQLDRATGSRPSGNNTGSFRGGHLTTVNGQQQRLTPEQQEDVDAANEMQNSFNGMNASAGGAGRGGMAPQRAPATTPRPSILSPLPPAQNPAQNLAAMRVAQSKADAAAVRGASGTPKPMGNGLHSFSGRVGGGAAPTGTYTPPAGRPMPKPPSAPATTPPPARGMGSALQQFRPMPKLPSGPTSSPDFKGAVE